MKAGDVFCFINFTFKDGDTAEKKLLIILNTPRGTEPYLACLTTSQQKWKSNQLGCHSEKNYYFVDSKQDNFDKDTWIVFDIIYKFPVERILNTRIKDGSYDLFELDSTLWKALKNCIAKSKDIEQDYLQMILS
ncbi:MAG: hypothetical protein CO127_04155 [Ignavibacteria bacterium CG_4_9_14_3_um_filter_36_18]|nr:MAG: hypothetical protein CO127_04155 [Ignavibacteria bacterium CG_4_9_14_3_um_filter_36_18]